ncbi:MAG: hypothetical protein K0Q74_608 [Gammaproteobacteria bacterium]|jgi:hypothetical protein|nr:hypothetical protein [Gammaproteobacteria bacterium]
MSSNEKNSEFLIYQTEDGLTEIQLKAQDGTVWLTQAEIAGLLQTSSQNITLHIKSIYEEGELVSTATCKDYLQVRREGERQIKRSLMHYNLEMILAIAYRVRSPGGTQFRRWATTTLKEYLVKGFVLNDERLKNPGKWDYFDALIEGIRDIRASEKRFYQKIRDIYATSIDYDTKSNAAQTFFKTVQNKMLWAVTGKTAAELIVKRVDANIPNMGLTSWQGHRVRKADVVIAKNYLNHDELTELNNIVTMFLDFAEDQARRRQAMAMKNWEERLDAFLTFNDRAVLTNAGSISPIRMQSNLLMSILANSMNITVV